jgi:hypothetical protein
MIFARLCRWFSHGQKRLPLQALGTDKPSQRAGAFEDEDDDEYEDEASSYRRRCATWLTIYANARMIRVRMPKFFLGGRLNPTGRTKYPNTKRIARIVSATIMSPGRSAVNIKF